MDVVAQNLSMEFVQGERTVEVLQDISLSVPSGQRVAVVGESGVGKTTLLYILGLLEQPTSGVVELGGRRFEAGKRSGGTVTAFRGENIGFVFQFHYLLPDFDAVENVCMPLLIKGAAAGAAKTRAQELLEKVGLAHRFSHRPGALSGGERQRVAIARALAANPGIVLADEPTGNLDHKTASEVFTRMLDVLHEEKATLLVATHSMELARSLDRIIELTPEGICEG